MICPECKKTHNQTERVPDGNTKCFECGYEDSTKAWAEWNNWNKMNDKRETEQFDKEFDAKCDMAKASLPHPLLNPDSTHYQMVDGVEAIERMEQMYTVEDRMAWAKISAMKYRLRIGNKDNAEKEAVKIRGYEAYYKYLQEKLNETK